ncbi:MAG: rhomboid family intramembrane serine protease [Bauldia sp.]
MTDSGAPAQGPSPGQPIFNIPGVVAGLVGLLAGVHVVRVALLGAEADIWLVRAFAFIPIRETHPAAFAWLFPGGAAAQLWSFVTYAFLHADWAHLTINGLWLVAFGSPLAWRFGPLRFLAFSAVGAVAGAFVHMLVFPQAFVPMVGASAAISAHMAGVSRFAFQRGGPLWGSHGPQSYRNPAPPLAEVVRDARVIAFLGVWLGINLLFGIGGAGSGIVSGAIAWEAHLGGFVAGLVLFPLFDPVPSRAA